MTVKRRLYIDEVGNSDLGASQDPNHRYLSLTGVIMELTYVNDVVHPRIEELKQRFFHAHVDEPLILHRKELVNRRPPFEALRDPEVEGRFNQELLTLLSELDYTVITAVIDKLEHRQHYQTWRYDPYHYCLHVLMERYVWWLRRRGATGDVMAESRGTKEDKRLKDSFERVCREGTEYVLPEQINGILTSRQLKVKPKAANISGLQLADLIAHPSFKAALAMQTGGRLPENFGGRIAQVLVDLKYDRKRDGTILGWGIKWLP
jgi:hypothetical protein